MALVANSRCSGCGRFMASMATTAMAPKMISGGDNGDNQNILHMRLRTGFSHVRPMVPRQHPPAHVPEAMVCPAPMEKGRRGHYI
jgi:hypothetical protein